MYECIWRLFTTSDTWNIIGLGGLSIKQLFIARRNCTMLPSGFLPRWPFSAACMYVGTREQHQLPFFCTRCWYFEILHWFVIIVNLIPIEESVERLRKGERLHWVPKTSPHPRRSADEHRWWWIIKCHERPRGIQTLVGLFLWRFSSPYFKWLRVPTPE